MKHLSISATFLNGTYHGEEWPPAPARLFQALVAGVMTGVYRRLRPGIEPALLWLERQPAPEIYAAPERPASAYRLAVPNNDMDAIAREWAAGRRANPADIRTMKTVAPRHLDPSAAPHVRYVWPMDAAPEYFAALQQAVRCLHTLGWGIDMACADVAAPAPDPYPGMRRWAPVKRGDVALPIPTEGLLEDLAATHRRFRARAAGSVADASTRPTMTLEQEYAMEGRERPAYALLALSAPDSDASYSESWHQTVVVAARMRHAAAWALRQQGVSESLITSFIEGHGEGEAKNVHMSFVPLPSIVGGHPDGRIRRVLFLEPPGSDGRIAELLEGVLPGVAAIDQHTKREVFSFAQPFEDRVSWIYTASSRVWRSATPVVLHGHNATNGRISLKKTERMLFRAFEMAGYRSEMIEGFAFQAAPLWRGCGAAFSFRLPKHLERLPRCHVEVRFRHAVRGPVIAGLGRHCGLGVFAKSGD
jgi:CRISPR-associated protein Csb2